MLTSTVRTSVAFSFQDAREGQQSEVAHIQIWVLTALRLVPKKKRILPLVLAPGFDETTLPDCVRMANWQQLPPNEDHLTATAIAESLRTDEHWLRLHVRLNQQSNDWLT